MKKWIVLMVIIVFGCDTARNTEEPQARTFVKYYGGDGNQYAADMLANPDGSFFLLGNSFSEAGAKSQVMLVKVDGQGFVLNEIVFESLFDEQALDIEPTVDGKFLILITRNVSDIDSDLRVIRVDSNGDPVPFASEAIFSFAVPSKELGSSITPVSLNGAADGFIIAGSTDSSEGGLVGKTALMIRFDNDGNLVSDQLWERSVGLEGDDFCTKVVPVNNVNQPFHFFGFTNSKAQIDNTSLNYWSSKVDGAGSTGVKTIVNDVTETDDEFLTSVTVKQASSTTVFGYILSGLRKTGSVFKPYLAAIYSPVNVETSLFINKTLDLPLGDLSTIDPIKRKVTVAVAHFPEDGYLVGSNALEGDNGLQIKLTKVDEEGNLIWSLPVTYGGSGEDYVVSLHEGTNNKIFLFGTFELGDEHQAKMVLLKLNRDGKLD